MKRQGIYILVSLLLCALVGDMQALFVNRWNRRQERAGSSMQSAVPSAGDRDEEGEVRALPYYAPDEPPAVSAAPRARNTISRIIISPSDVTRLQRKLAQALKKQGEEQIAAVSRSSGKAFTPSESFMQEQARARTQLAEKVVPYITTTLSLSPDTTDLDPVSPKFASVIDIAAIAALKPQQMRSIMEALFQGLRVLPPVPGGATQWAEVVVPLFSFSAQAQRELGELIQSWVAALLENPADLKSIIAAAKLPEARRSATIDALRTKYRALQHNASQLLYAWIQIASILNANGPLSLFLEYGTRDAGNLKRQFESLISKARTELAAVQGKKVSAQDATGFVLLTMQTLFAPNALASLMEERRDGARAAAAV